MTNWEYKTAVAKRKGSQEDFGLSGWTYGPWELTRTEPDNTQALDTGLQQLGFEGWELAGIMPTDMWSEGTRVATSSHGVRGITAMLIFKRPIGD